MKQQRRFFRFIVLTSLCIPLLATGQPDRLDDALRTQTDTQQSAAKSQKTVDTLDDETRRLLAQYREATLELDELNAYNGQLERMVANQIRETATLNKELQEIEVTKRHFVPLMLRMVEVLETFITLDTPFLTEERAQRLAQLKSLMDRTDVSLAEKYRRVMEAYQVEMGYGHTVEAYRGVVTIDEQPRTVDFLRFGRLGLYYQSFDQQQVGYWDRAQQNWQPLPTHYANAIAQGLRIARKQAPPDLVPLPIEAPEVTP